MENEVNNFMDSAYLADTIRCTGYKSAENAISEIIDNSIEAEAKETFIIVKEGPINGGKGITEIAFLDNGKGMDEKTLGICLKLGASPKRELRKGIGRFGVGLTQASMSVCPRVEVYSWQNGVENCNMVHLDLEEVENKTQTNYVVEKNVQIPEEYKYYLNRIWPAFKNKEIDFRAKGTLVIWRNCDRNLPKKEVTLFERLEKNLGRKFRYLIASQEQEIYLISQNNPKINCSILPNDPLFLMENNLVLGDPENPTKYQLRNGGNFVEPFFEPYVIEGISNDQGEQEVEIEYFDNKENKKKTSKIIIKFSIVKEKFYSSKYIEKKPGLIGVGKEFISKLEGISIIRSNREIDFGRFGFAENAEKKPEDRWWGCEIRFTPELDETFGVSNNKQGVILERIEEDEEIDYYEDRNDIKPVWLQIRDVVEKTIRDMRKRNTALRPKSSRENSVIAASESAMNNCDETRENIKTITENQKENMTEEEKREEAIKTLKGVKNVEEPNEEDIEKILLNKVTIGYAELSRDKFFDIELKRGICKCIINTDNIFYKKFFEKIKDNPESVDTFEIFLASIARVIDESPLEEEDKLIDFVDEWNHKLTKYIKSQYGGE